MGLFIFFLVLNCISKTINVTDDNCKIMLKIINIKFDAQPGIEDSVNSFIYKIEITDKKHNPTPNKDIFNMRTDKKSK